MKPELLQEVLPLNSMAATGRLLGLAPNTVKKMLESGQFHPVYVLGRPMVRREEIVELLAGTVAK